MEVDKPRMETRTRFGSSDRARLNHALMGALAASAPDCESCSEIRKELLETADGGEFLEAASFPGRTVQKLNAHFKSHWKDGYEYVDLSGWKPTISESSRPSPTP